MHGVDLIDECGLVGRGALPEGIEGGIDLLLGFVVREEEGVVAGGLVSAEPGLLIDDEALDEEGLGDCAVCGLDVGDGLVGVVDLPVDGCGSDQDGEDGYEKDLPQDVVEPC